ncbi:hypothetical protein [Vibrio alginolyticus]|uniref:hypothetical protein n=1 Tax=Vibrio alginolyticus TaxID=663 RepID=UPI0035C778F9
MIGICPETGETLNGKPQLVARLDRFFRTVKTTRAKHRDYGTTSRDYLGKNNNRMIITKLQNLMLTEISREPSFSDIEIEQVKVLPDGKIFLVGKMNNEQFEASI